MCRSLGTQQCCTKSFIGDRVVCACVFAGLVMTTHSGSVYHTGDISRMSPSDTISQNMSNKYDELLLCVDGAASEELRCVYIVATLRCYVELLPTGPLVSSAVESLKCFLLPPACSIIKEASPCCNM